MNLSIDKDKWFYRYKGYVYANKPTKIHTRIDNKVLIDRGNVKCVGDDEAREVEQKKAA